MTSAAPPFDGKLEPAADPAWAGWYHWSGNDPFEDDVGPFYVRRDEQGLVTGFRPGPKNCNAHGSIHGGCLMTFGDFSLFMIASALLAGALLIAGLDMAQVFLCVGLANALVTLYLFVQEPDYGHRMKALLLRWTVRS